MNLKPGDRVCYVPSHPFAWYNKVGYVVSLSYGGFVEVWWSSEDDVMGTVPEHQNALMICKESNDILKDML